MENIPILIRQLERISQIKPESLEKLFDIFPEQLPDLWKSMVLGAYLSDDINLSKAAELLGKHPIELRHEFIKQGIPIKIGLESLEDAKAEINVMESL